MWANKNYNTGFTIVETLIVLAVSAGLFLSVALLVSGQVARNEERQAANSLEIYTRDVLNDVATGYYPETGVNFTCTNGGGPAPTVGNGGAATRGTNSNCVFAGKKVTFKSTTMEIDTVVALATLNTVTNVGSQLTVVNGLKETIQYPFKATKPGGDQVYYVLNKLLSPTAGQETTFVGGGQGVNVVDTLNSSSAAGFNVCFDNGGSFTKLIVGAKNGTNVEMQQGLATCP